MRACINQCGEVAEHGPYCTDCANEGRAEKRGRKTMLERNRAAINEELTRGLRYDEPKRFIFPTL